MTNEDNVAESAEQVDLSPEEALEVAIAPEGAAQSSSLSGVPVDELLKRLDIEKREVMELKAKVANANKKKEAAFRRKQDVGKQIGDKIGEITGSKTERNSITGEVRELKKKRDELNSQIREKVAEIKKLTEENKDALGSSSFGYDRKTGPAALKTQIEALEFKLETQPMGFEAEQKVNKKIKELKKLYNDTKEKAGAAELVHEKSREIDRLKREANRYHRQVQEHAQQSQSKHEALLSESKDIDEFKKKEEELYQAFLTEKKIYTDLSQQLKDHSLAMQAIKDELNKQNVKVKEDQRRDDLKTLKDRAKEAEEKVRTRKKLTTEDILALQGLK